MHLGCNFSKFLFFGRNRGGGGRDDLREGGRAAGRSNSGSCVGGSEGDQRAQDAMHLGCTGLGKTKKGLRGQHGLRGVWDGGNWVFPRLRGRRKPGIEAGCPRSTPGGFLGRGELGGPKCSATR